MYYTKKIYIKDELIEKYRVNNFVANPDRFEPAEEYTRTEQIFVNKHEDIIREMAYMEHRKLEQIAEELFKNMEEECVE